MLVRQIADMKDKERDNITGKKRGEKEKQVFRFIKEREGSVCRSLGGEESSE